MVAVEVGDDGPVEKTIIDVKDFGLDGERYDASVGEQLLVEEQVAALVLNAEEELAGTIVSIASIIVKTGTEPSIDEELE